MSLNPKSSVGPIPKEQNVVIQHFVKNAQGQFVALPTSSLGNNVETQETPSSIVNQINNINIEEHNPSSGTYKLYTPKNLSKQTAWIETTLLPPLPSVDTQDASTSQEQNPTSPVNSQRNDPTSPVKKRARKEQAHVQPPLHVQQPTTSSATPVWGYKEETNKNPVAAYEKATLQSLLAKDPKKLTDKEKIFLLEQKEIFVYGNRGYECQLPEDCRNLEQIILNPDKNRKICGFAVKPNIIARNKTEADSLAIRQHIAKSHGDQANKKFLCSMCLTEGKGKKSYLSNFFVFLSHVVDHAADKAVEVLATDPVDSDTDDDVPDAIPNATTCEQKELSDEEIIDVVNPDEENIDVVNDD